MSILLDVLPDSPARLMTPDEMENYHGNDGISQSGLKLFLKDPLRYWRERVKQPADQRPPPSASMQFGKEVEAFLFEKRVNVVEIPDSALGTTVSYTHLTLPTICSV